ncbi:MULTISPECIES: YdbH domain-containing protein [unclassified Shewanella]|uniref:YdbH domain-containing protein n=1 Tax=unclassified Shewanella TaxID=196818 RepID=UPI0021D8E78A|nr:MULTISPECIES: YdbH domain-containing protein [unclassified Shewanella]MCU8022182.1 YdbH domain-containing protein [Shewanella sp. SM78]MCU8079472.1 YdbH domain-containing protein [Shewanella sp. SM103]
MPIHNKPSRGNASDSKTLQHEATQISADPRTGALGFGTDTHVAAQNRRKFPLKKTLLATSLTGILAGVALTVWIVNTQAEQLIIRAANFALTGMDSELIDIELGQSQLEHWQITSANLRVHDSHIKLNDLNIQLKLDWPQSFAELKQFSQASYLTQKITQISTGDIEVELGQSLFLPNRNAIDEQGPALALDIKSLPLIDIGKTSLILNSHHLNTHNDLPAYRLVMDKLSLNGAGEINSEFSHAGESIAILKATLETNKWQLMSQIQLAPLLASLHQISLRQAQDSVLSPLTELDKDWQALAIDLQGQLISNSSITLTSGELISEHQLIEPKLTFNQLAALQLAPKPELGSKPKLAFKIAGHLAELDLSLEPLTLALTPNAAQQQRLMQLLDETLAKPSSQSVSEPVSQPIAEQVPDPLASQIAKLLSGLKSTDTPVGIALTLPEALHYPLTHIPQDVHLANPLAIKLPRVKLKTLGSKLDTQVDLANVEITKSTEALSFKTDWRLSTRQTGSMQLSELWANPPQDFSWNNSQLTTAGTFNLVQTPSSTDWQFITAATESTELTQSAKKNTGNTLQFAVGELKRISMQNKNAAKHAEFSLGSIAINALAPLNISSLQSTHTQSSGIQNASIQKVSPAQSSVPTSDTANRLTLAIPPLTLALEQLYFSQTKQTLVTDGVVTEANADKNASTSIITKTDMNAGHFSIALQKAMSFELKPDIEALFDSILATTWRNQLAWQASQLNIEKQLSSKGRSRKETVLKLDKLTLAQSLDWKNNTLFGDEHWQVGTVELQSQHKLNLATANNPLVLTGQWVVNTSMTEALALLNQTQPLPSELNVTGNNQLQAQFNLTQQRDQTQFAMQITQSMTELEGFYKDIIFEGGKLQAQCEFTWGQSYKKESHNKSQDKGYFSSLSKLNCPQTLMTFNLFDPGFPLTDIEVEADIALGKDAEKLPDNWIQQLTGLSDTDVSMTAKGKVLSGQFLLPEFNLKLQDKSHAYLLLQAMSLEEVLRIQPQIGIYADGIFDGVLPVDLINGKVSITGGQLAARAPGGLIAISGNPAVEQMRQSQPYLDFVFSTLEHLQYSQLSSSFDMDQAGDAKLLVEVKGRGEGIERPIHLNYSHEENMLQLFRSLQIGNDLQDRIEKSVK